MNALSKFLRPANIADNQRDRRQVARSETGRHPTKEDQGKGKYGTSLQNTFID